MTPPIETSANELDALVEDICKAFGRIGEVGVDASIWSSLTESGLDRIGLDESLGGSGGNILDVASVIRRLSYETVSTGVVEQLVAAWLAGRVGLPLPAARVTVADGGGTVQVVRLDDGGLRVDGSVSRVPWAGACEMTLLLIEVGDQLAAAIVRNEQTNPRTNEAGESRDDLIIDETTVEVDSWKFVRAELRQELESFGALARAIAISGAARRSLDECVAYVNARTQFGRSIGSFQVLRHKVAELAAHVAELQCVTELAVMETGGADTWPWEIAVAKADASALAGPIATIAHQLHGAIGFTKEHALQGATRRLWAWRNEFGSEKFWSGKIADEALGADDLWELVTA